MSRIEHTLLDEDKPLIRPKTAARLDTAYHKKVTSISFCRKELRVSGSLATGVPT
jgi:hypothetical protein